MKKNLLTAILLVAASAFWTNTLYAQERASVVSTVRRIYSMANRPDAPQFSHMIFFELTDMSWFPATCANNLMILPDAEKTAAATLLSAYIAKKKVQVYIEDTVKTGGYCHAVIIFTTE